MEMFLLSPPWKFVALTHLITIWSWSALLLMELLPTPLEIKMLQSFLIHMVRYYHVYLLVLNLLTLFPFLLGRLQEMLIIPRDHRALSQCAYDYVMVVIGLLHFKLIPDQHHNVHTQKYNLLCHLINHNNYIVKSFGSFGARSQREAL